MSALIQHWTPFNGFLHSIAKSNGFYSSHAQTFVSLFYPEIRELYVVYVVFFLSTLYFVQLTHFSALKCNDNAKLGHYRSHFWHYGISYRNTRNKWNEKKATYKQKEIWTTLLVKLVCTWIRFRFMCSGFSSLILAPK